MGEVFGIGLLHTIDVPPVYTGIRFCLVGELDRRLITGSIRSRKCIGQRCRRNNIVCGELIGTPIDPLHQQADPVGTGLGKRE